MLYKKYVWGCASGCVHIILPISLTTIFSVLIKTKWYKPDATIAWLCSDATYNILVYNTVPMSATFTELISTVHLDMTYWCHVVVCVLDLHFTLHWPRHRMALAALVMVPITIMSSFCWKCWARKLYCLMSVKAEKVLSQKIVLFNVCENTEKVLSQKIVLFNVWKHRDRKFGVVEHLVWMLYVAIWKNQADSYASNTYVCLFCKTFHTLGHIVFVLPVLVMSILFFRMVRYKIYGLHIWHAYSTKDDTKVSHLNYDLYVKNRLKNSCS